MGYAPCARRKLGSAALQVTQLGLGCGSIGGFRAALAEGEAQDILRTLIHEVDLGREGFEQRYPGAVRPAEVLRNAEHLRARVPADLWAELKHERLLHSAAPVPA